MTDETSDGTVGAPKAGSNEQVVHDSAGSLGLGLSLVLGGAIVLFVVGVLRIAPNATGMMLFLFIGGTAVVIGLIQAGIGVYQLAQNVDRMAKAVLNGQGDQPPGGAAQPDLGSAEGR